MKPFRPQHTHFRLHGRVKARQWATTGASFNALPLPDHLSKLSDAELAERGHKVVSVNGKRHLSIFIHHHE